MYSRKVVKETLQPVLDEQCYNWLESYYPHIIPGLELLAVDNTVKPDDIARNITIELGSDSGKLASHCKNAFRHIRRVNKERYG